MRYFIDISYKGTNYHGWQIQPNGITIQEEMEKALSTLLKSDTTIVGSGRTDAGVHATQQIAHFEHQEPLDTDELAYKLNSFLHPDISINGIRKVKDQAHARFDAKKRTYHYHFHHHKNPFLAQTSYMFNQPLNIELIQEACKLISKWKNFECFSKVHTEVSNFQCDIHHAEWISGEDSSTFIVTANRFLRGMVRAMVGTLLDVGLGKITLDQLTRILKSNDRRRAGRAVPAIGLFLERIEYAKSIYQ